MATKNPAVIVPSPISVQKSFEDQIVSLAESCLDTGKMVRYLYRRECKVKKGSPFIEKISNGLAQIATYEDAVNRNRAKEKKETDFVSQGLSHGKWEKGNEGVVQISGTGQRCLRLSSSSKMREADSFKAKIQYLIDGQETTYEEIEQYLLASEKHSVKEVQKEAQEDRTNLDNSIHPFMLKLSGILEFSAAGVRLER